MVHGPRPETQAGDTMRAWSQLRVRRETQGLETAVKLFAGPSQWPAASLPRPPRRVLCTDRDAGAAERLVRALRLVGFDARACYASAAALVEITEFRPHACVLDLDTPGLGGYELARWARSTIGDRVLLIALADCAGIRTDGRASGAGFDLVFDRPADPALVIGLAAGPGAARGV